MPRVSIIIPTWNGKHHLETCLPSLAQQTFQDFEIVIVDNGSADGTVAWLATAWPDVQIVALPHNIGVTGAFNEGVVAARGDYLLLLNNDTEADSNFLAELVRVADAYPDAGMVAAKLRLFDDRTRLHAAGDYYTVSGRPGNRGVWQVDEGQWDTDEPIFAPCGGAALYRRALFEQIGLFDSRFESYLEDVDLAWRAQLAGWGCRLAYHAIVYHKVSATGGGPLASFYNGRNWLYVILKNMPAPLLRRYWRAILREQLTITVDALKAWRGAAARARLRGQLAGVLALPRLLRWRRQVQGHRNAQVSDSDIAALLSPPDAGKSTDTAPLVP